MDGCGAFVVLVGRDGVRRWIGAETQAALNRYFGPHDDAQRLPIFPILLDGTGAGDAAGVPAAVPDDALERRRSAAGRRLLADIRERNIVRRRDPVRGLPVRRARRLSSGSGAPVLRPAEGDAGRARLLPTRGPAGPPVRWLEINGNSGSGKSSLMQAGLLPLIDQGWLWPRTGYAHWRRIGPMMPGAHPVEMLAERSARARSSAKMAESVSDLRMATTARCATGCASRKQDDTAFLLAIDQFEELFTFADADERRRFDRLLAGALEDPDCPLFVISTVRADFLDRFAEDLPRLVARAQPAGQAVDAGADRRRRPARGHRRPGAARRPRRRARCKEAMVAEARDEPGALPLVENALHWLWEKRDGQPPERPAVHRPRRARRHPQPRRRRAARRPGRAAAGSGAGAAVPAGQGGPGGRRGIPASGSPLAEAVDGRRRRRGRPGRGRPPRRPAPAATAARRKGRCG